MIVVLLGPTASGKTDLACALADELPVDLISMDSAMVYKGMDIGTAKPSASELRRYPHHLIDILDPTETYSAADFVQDADALVRASLQSDRIPLIVGGTMLYARAFREGMADLPSADVEVRAIGWPALHQELMAIDPEAAAGIHPNNHQRLQRALEVIEISGRPLSSQWRESGVNATRRLGSKVVEVCVDRERRIVHQQIEQRFDAMLALGFIDERAA